MFLWNFLIPSVIGTIELFACYWGWRQYYYGGMPMKFVSAKFKRRVVLPLFVSIPLYLLCVAGWWGLCVVIVPHMSPLPAIPWFSSLVVVAVLNAVSALFVYSIAEDFCQKYIAPRLLRDSSDSGLEIKDWLHYKAITDASAVDL